MCMGIIIGDQSKETAFGSPASLASASGSVVAATIENLQDAAIDLHDWEGTAHGHDDGHLATDERATAARPAAAAASRTAWPS